MRSRRAGWLKAASGRVPGLPSPSGHLSGGLLGSFQELAGWFKSSGRSAAAPGSLGASWGPSGQFWAAEVLSAAAKERSGQESAAEQTGSRRAPDASRGWSGRLRTLSGALSQQLRGRAQDIPWTAQPGQTRTAQDRPGQLRIQNGPGQTSPGQTRIAQDRRNSSAGTRMTAEDSPEQRRIAKNSPGQTRTAQNRPEQTSSDQHRSVQLPSLV